MVNSKARRYVGSMVNLALAGMLLLGVLVSQDAAAAEVRIAGTRVLVAAPPGFESASPMPALVDAASGASIAVVEMAIPLEQARAALTDRYFASQSMTVLERGAATIDGRGAALLKLRQPHGDALLYKWMAVFGDARSSVLLIGTVPEDAGLEAAAGVRLAILGARWDTGAEPDLFEGLNYAFKETAGLKYAQRYSASLVLRRPGDSGHQGGGDPSLLVSPVHEESWNSRELPLLSRQILGAMNGATPIKEVIEAHPIRVGGVDAYEIVASATEAQDGTPLIIYQAVFPGRGGPLVMLGRVGLAMAGDYLPQFRQAAGSVVFSGQR